MNDQAPRPGLAGILRSPWGPWALVLMGIVYLGWKIDSLEQRVSSHRHGEEAESSSSPSSHLHEGGQSSPGTADTERPHPHGPFHAATHPPTGRLGLVPEWSPLSAVAVALPGAWVDDRGYLQLLGDLAEVCLRRTSVDWIVAVEQNDVTARAAFDAIIETRRLPHERIRYFEAKSLDSVWIRDYGPVFLKRQDDGQLFLVDMAYRDLRLPGDPILQEITPPLRPSDDMVPIWMATYLNKPYVHPGLIMNGGDLYADGTGTLYTSEETLHLNAGDRDFVSGVFRQYLGVREVRYLAPLPGPAVKHLDMFFKLASPKRCLLGQYSLPAGNTELEALQRAAAKALDDNAERLARNGVAVTRVPMPPLERTTRWDYFGRVFTPKQREQRIRELSQGAGITPEALQRRLQTTHVYVYRTYLNSILIQSKLSGSPAVGGARLLVIPKYRDTTQAEQERLGKAYREAYPGTLDVAMVNAETLSYANGSLRCLICPIPAD